MWDMSLIRAGHKGKTKYEECWIKDRLGLGWWYVGNINRDSTVRE